MRVLQLCHKPPRPAIDGGCIAMDNLTKGLLEAGHDVKVLCVSTHKHPFHPDNMSSEYQKLTGIEAIYIDTRLNFVDAFSNLVTRDSYNISRFFSPDLDMKLERILHEADDFDVVQVESLFMTPYISTIRRFSNAKIILRSHNLEYKIWQRMANVSSTGPRKAYLNHLAKKLKEYELSVIQEVDGIATISTEDTAHYLSLGCDRPIETIPFGVDTASYSCEVNPTLKPDLFHIGAMDWMPNIEGIHWFLDHAWEDILEAYPQFKLHLAGKSIEKGMKKRSTPGLIIDGAVDNAQEYMRDRGIMIVPLLSGGGIRIKIIEGMALGKVIISTSIGAEGIGATDGKDILIADEPAAFKRTLDRLHQEPGLYENISRNARKFIVSNFDNSVLTRKLVDFYIDKKEKEEELAY